MFKYIRKDKYFCNWNNERGITLITLVITIVILLILAGIIILNLKNSKLLNNTKSAKDSNDYSVAYEKLVLKIN